MGGGTDNLIMGYLFLIFPKGKLNPLNPLNLIWVLGVSGAWVGGL